MNMKIKATGAAAGVLAAVIAVASGACDAKKDVSHKTSEASIVTNDNGSVSKTFTECTVATNGNMVTEHRRETRTTMDVEGNMLATTTSEYARSYPVGENGIGEFTSDTCRNDRADDSEERVSGRDSFLGMRFGEVFDGTNFVVDASEPMLLRASFKPKKALAGFDDYFVYVTPVSHKIAKVCACAKNEVDPGENWRRHYLIEALEKHYRSWARLSSWSRPRYTFDIGSGRFVAACLSDASADYGTVVVAWDENVFAEAGREVEKIRQEARRNAAEKRKSKIEDAASAF